MGYAAALTAVFLWSFNYIIAAYFAYSLTPYELSFGRWLVAVLILVPLVWRELVRIRHVLVQNWRLLVGLAVSGMVLDNTLIYFAGREDTPLNMSLLSLTSPIFIALLARIFFKTRISQRQFMGFVVALAGVLVIVSRGKMSILLGLDFSCGDVLVLANALCFAVYSVLQNKRPTGVSQMALLAASSAVSLVFLLPPVLWQTGAKQLLSLTPVDIEVLIYLGVFNSVGAYLAWNWALTKIGSIRAGVIYYLLPFFSGIEAYYFLNEGFSAVQVLGGGMVIAGIMLASRKEGC